MARIALVLAALGAVSCGTLLSSTDPNKPKDLVCGKLYLASGTGEALTDALAGAQGGDCVVAAGATYRGSFTVPTDVSLVASEGATVVLTGDSADQPALRVMGGPHSTIRGIRVASSTGMGIVVDPGPAFLVGVSVTKAGKAGLMASCTGADCLDDAHENTFSGVDVSECAIGLWVAGTRATLTGGRVAGSKAQSLTSGHGVIASHGARLVMTGTTVENNEAIGVLVDGTSGTGATLTDVKVLGNLDRGIWAQGLLGSDAVPKLVITGDSTLIDSNRIAGVGARDSSGVSITGGTISNTLKASIPVTLGTLEDVGDGVGLFSGTGAARIENVTLTGNFRSQVLVDQGLAGIHVANAPTAGGKYQIVVQKTLATVDAPASQLSAPGVELGVSAPAIPVQ